jgi:hypothetical protein
MRKNYLMQITLFDNQEVVKMMNKFSPDFKTEADICPSRF